MVSCATSAVAHPGWRVSLTSPWPWTDGVRRARPVALSISTLRLIRAPPAGAPGVAATPPSLRLRRSFTLPPALPSIGGAVAGTPYRLRCNYHVMTHHDGRASCRTTQISPSWPRAGHPCGDTAVPLPAGFVCGRVHRAGREPGILVGIHGAVTSWLYLLPWARWYWDRNSPNWPRAGYP
jgi:hypothetical protein